MLTEFKIKVCYWPTLANSYKYLVDHMIMYNGWACVLYHKKSSWQTTDTCFSKLVYHNTILITAIQLSKGPNTLQII